MASLVIARQRILMALTSLGNRSRNFSEKINLVGIEKPMRTVKEQSASSKLDEMITKVQNDSLVNVSQPFTSDYFMQLENSNLMLNRDVEKLKTVLDEQIEKIRCEDSLLIDDEHAKQIIETCEKLIVGTCEKEFTETVKEINALHEQQLKDAKNNVRANWLSAVTAISAVVRLLYKFKSHSSGE